MNQNDVVAYYDNIAGSYDESRFNNSYGKFIDAQERKVLNRLIPLQADSLRLEMACGTGRLTNYATHALDASSEMMKLAQQRHEGVEFRHASATDTGYPDEMFDVVYTFHLLMHLDDATIRQIFDEVHRILKPGGRFIFDIPSKKRRHLLHHRQTSWHGATDMTKDELNEMIGDKFQIKGRYGIMMLPVHQLPVRMRHSLQRIDYMLANSCMKDYSSYLVFELKKN